MSRRILQVVLGVLCLALVVWIGTKGRERPALPKWKMEERLMGAAMEADERRKARLADINLVKGLLEERLDQRLFDFALVVEASSGKKVVPLDGRTSHERVLTAIGEVMGELVVEMSAADSPVRGLRRINEGSRFFEDALQLRLDAREGLSCEFPMTRAGVVQRSGYPDLKITDERTGEVFYLDPKLVEESSLASTLRTFYFEPKGETLKITEDAVHLLIGIEHDGKAGEWTFSRWNVVDLSSLQVRLKAEFQASNRDLYKR